MKKYLPSMSEVVKFVSIIAIFNLVLKFLPANIKQYLMPPAA